MADVYLYADETGDLDLTGTVGSSNYFGIGTATFNGDHRDAVWDGLALRFEAETKGLRLAKGFHAVRDTKATRHGVFALVQKQAPRFDVTLLRKSSAYPHIVARGQMYVYKLAWHLHFKEVVRRVSSPGDTVHVIAATLGTAQRKTAAWNALYDVCVVQAPADREVVLCQWDAATAWGLQVADYGLWAVQRKAESSDASWMPYVEPTLATDFRPWGG